MTGQAVSISLKSVSARALLARDETAQLSATERAPIVTAVMLAFMPLTCGLVGYQPSRWTLGPTRTSRGRAAVSLSATPPSVLCVGECLFDALP